MGATDFWKKGRPRDKIVAAGLLCMAVLSATASLPARALESRPAPVAGQLLVAAPSMRDPRFRNAVIYLCRFDEGGAFGIVLNRQLALVDSRFFAETLGLDAPGVDANSPDGAVRLLWGGPVELGRVFVLHSTDYLPDSALRVTESIALTSGSLALEALIDGRGPEQALFALGYAGWGARQLESELAREDWFLIDAGPKFIFREDLGSMWRAAMDLMTVPL